VNRLRSANSSPRPRTRSTRAETTAALGPRDARVRELRALLRDRRTRRDAQRFVAEGPRLVAAALDHAAPVDSVLVAADAPEATQAVAQRARDRRITVEQLAPGVAERLGGTVTTQGVFAIVRHDPPVRALPDGASFVVVVATVNDPGNAGTLWRSAAAAGADAFVLGAGSVDAYNPKLVRATAGACFSVPVLEDADITSVLDDCGASGLWRAGAVVRGGTAPDAVDFTQPCALVLGHEARGLEPGLPLDGLVTVPMARGTESLNLAMAGSVLCFEVARQRRTVAP
jgi:TrmH family RNA methyltransferase